ncbi:MAG: 3-methyl-2-oxobutanoate hydroxymethyltransferase [Chloroflexi bacterium]|nr:3-methyl-2-oxobutanoate hydroxymethyltransferase [Chloroflexota bacterium]
MRTTISQILDLARSGQKIPMLTAYDSATARLLDAAGIPLILVGDSLGQVMLGYDSTLPVTMDDMIRHTSAVVRGAQNAFIVGDMPFMSYQISESDALANAGRFLKEAGCQGVKLEGGRQVAPLVEKLVGYGIPVMGHVGLTPQSINQLGGPRLQARTAAQAKVLLDDALALERAGAFSVVLELVPAQVSRMISDRLEVPTIGIGAGPDCDGQVLVISDLLGMNPAFHPKFLKRYAELAETIRSAAQTYAEEVKSGAFPDREHSHWMSAEEEALLSDL